MKTCICFIATVPCMPVLHKTAHLQKWGKNIKKYPFNL